MKKFLLNLQLHAEPGDGDPGSQGGEPPASNPNSENSKTFTQDDVDSIVKARLERERTKIAKDMGLPENFNKEDFQKYLKHQEDQKTDLQKLQEQNDALKAQAQEAMTLKANNAVLKAGVSPEFADYVAFQLQQTMKEGESYDDAVKAFKEANPQYFQQSNTPGRGGLSNKGGGTKSVDGVTAHLQKKYPGMKFGGD